MNRNLDGAYFRIKRDGKWQNICFSDLTADERKKIGEIRSREWWRDLAYHLADSLKELGDELNVCRGDDGTD